MRLAALVAGAGAFYVPGLAPVDYDDGEAVEMRVRARTRGGVRGFRRRSRLCLLDSGASSLWYPGSAASGRIDGMMGFSAL